MPNNPDPSPKITPTILHDLPLQDETADFHFEEFAITLARLIASKNTRTPLTIGISGSWGAGKTTLLHRLEHLLNQTSVLYDKTKPELMGFVGPKEEPGKLYRPCRTVWFNAWKYADEDALLVALVRKIVQTMAEDSRMDKAFSKLLDPSYPRRDVVATVLSWFSIKVGDVGVELNTGEPVETPFAKNTALLDLFDDAFTRLMGAWVHRRINARKINPDSGILVVFIDDLDRCLPAKTVQVLEAVKLFLDKSGCVFVLGADIAHIERAVTAHYEKTGVIGETASDYLEKVIQLRFPLPPIEVDKMEAFLSKMKVGDTTLITEEWGESWKLLITGAEVNPRKVKTIMNDLSLQWAMLVNSGQAEGVNRQDFNTWQVLMRIAPRNFVVRVRDQIDDVELRYKFVMEAMEWVRGGEAGERVAANYRDYDGSYRLKRVLKQLTFSETFDAPTLEAFIYLAAPPSIEISEKLARKVDIADVEAALKKAGLRVGQEPVRVAARPREGVQVRGGIEFVHIPAGRFLMGSKEDNYLAHDDEQPQHPVEIPYEYWIGRFPVTNEQYSLYTQEKGFQHPVENWQEKKDHPVVNVSWDDAVAYCQWLNEKPYDNLPQGYTFRLLTEAEWEKAARGEYGNEWPWGNNFDSSKCNSSEGGLGETSPVDAYSFQGESPYGAADMVGNVWEWTNTIYKAYPYNAQDGRESSDRPSSRVLRGGAYNGNRGRVRAASRNDRSSDFRYQSYGFRVCVAPKLS